MAPAPEASRVPGEQSAERLRSRNPYGTEARSTDCPGAEGTCVLQGPMIPQQQALALGSTVRTCSAGELTDRRDGTPVNDSSPGGSRSRRVSGAVGWDASAGWAAVLLEAEGVRAVVSLTRVQLHDWAGNTTYGDRARS